MPSLLANIVFVNITTTKANKDNNLFDHSQHYNHRHDRRRSRRFSTAWPPPRRRNDSAARTTTQDIVSLDHFPLFSFSSFSSPVTSYCLYHLAPLHAATQPLRQRLSSTTSCSNLARLLSTVQPVFPATRVLARAH